MKKQTLFTIAYWILIIAVVLFLIWIVGWLQSESGMCMKDPIKYFAEGTDQMCFCNGQRITP